MPYLFRTTRGYNLLVRGPANSPKDGAYPLEGLVETDWSVATFTMNWKLTRPDLPVTFVVDEPICMVVPQRRGELETFQPHLKDIREEPNLEGAFRRWSLSRDKFLDELRLPGSEASRGRWQKDYFRGTDPDGHPEPQHQVKLELPEFQDADIGRH